MAISFPTLPSTRTINARLDELETRLPTIPARILRLQRSLAAPNCERTSAAVSAVTESAKSFFDTARTSGKTWSRAGSTPPASDVVGSVRTGVTRSPARPRRRAGGSRSAAESRRPSSSTGHRGRRGDLDAADDAVERSPIAARHPYEQWTKAELVERAKELNIVGPTRMSKSELIDALPRTAIDRPIVARSKIARSPSHGRPGHGRGARAASPCPGWDSNPHRTDFEAVASANWATGAAPARLTLRPSTA